MKIPRCDTNGVGEYEVTVQTVTSGRLHKQREQRLTVSGPVREGAGEGEGEKERRRERESPLYKSNEYLSA